MEHMEVQSADRAGRLKTTFRKSSAKNTFRKKYNKKYFLEKSIAKNYT